MPEVSPPVGPAEEAGARRGRGPRRWLAVLGHGLTSAPLTWGSLLVLLVTTAVLRHVPADVAHDLLASSSTDVAHLGRDPLRVLALSPLWLPGRIWVPYALMLVLVLVAAPLERRIGTARTALVFLSGHVLATLLTELPIAAAIAAGWLPPGSAHRVDVGASYGVMAVVAAATGGATPLRGLAVLLVAGALVTGVPAIPPDMTTYGHALSVVIGVCWWPKLYGRVPWRRRRRVPPSQP